MGSGWSRAIHEVKSVGQVFETNSRGAAEWLGTPYQLANRVLVTHKDVFLNVDTFCLASIAPTSEPCRTTPQFSVSLAEFLRSLTVTNCPSELTLARRFR